MPDISSRLSEQQRLHVLDSYKILDSSPEAGFDDIVLLARNICQTPVALVSFVAEDRQWFKAVSGFDGCETSLERSVCAHALRQNDTLVIPDLTQDVRTKTNALVTADPFIRFYAGALIKTASGVALGTVCVIDTVPRPGGLNLEQVAALEALARQVMVQMDLRRAVLDGESGTTRLRAITSAMSERAREGRRAHELLKADETRLRQAQAASKIGSFEIDIATDELSVTEEFCRIFGVPFSPVMPSKVIEGLVVAEDQTSGLHG